MKNYFFVITFYRIKCNKICMQIAINYIETNVINKFGKFWTYPMLKNRNEH